MSQKCRGQQISSRENSSTWCVNSVNYYSICLKLRRTYGVGIKYFLYTSFELFLQPQPWRLFEMCEPEESVDPHGPPAGQLAMLCEVKLPTFKHSRPTAWFQLADSRFSLKNVTDPQM
jgi:hypothetical protein